MQNCVFTGDGTYSYLREEETVQDFIGIPPHVGCFNNVLASNMMQVCPTISLMHALHGTFLDLLFHKIICDIVVNIE